MNWRIEGEGIEAVFEALESQICVLCVCLFVIRNVFIFIINQLDYTEDYTVLKVNEKKVHTKKSTT